MSVPPPPGFRAVALRRLPIHSLVLVQTTEVGGLGPGVVVGAHQTTAERSLKCLDRKLKNILVTGRPGIGKTSVVEAVAREFPQVAGGFTTSEIREHGVRKGFRVTPLDGSSAVLAHVDFSGLARVGKYGVDVAALERLALPALEDAVRGQW